MNKLEITDAIAMKTGQTKADAKRFMDALIETVISAVNESGHADLSGLGKFVKKHRAARAGRNPQTGATIQIAASNVVGFKTAKAFKDAIQD